MTTGDSRKAYENLEFLNSHDARVVRILAEYLEPQQRFDKHGVRDTVVLFGSARTLPLDVATERFGAQAAGGEHVSSDERRFATRQLALAEYYDQARELSRRLTEWGAGRPHGTRHLICSGGGPGMMEAANRGAAEAGGPSIGLNISLPNEQGANQFVSPDLDIEFHYFFMRKFWFLYLAKAVVIFPGGYGTMDELFEVLTLITTGKLQKEVAIVLYGTSYWNEILNLEKLVEWGTISEADLALVHRSDDVDDAFATIVDALEPGRADT